MLKIRKKYQYNQQKQKKIIVLFLLISYSSFIIEPFALAQQIITDGRTNTTLTVNGTTTDVNTSTVRGINAFNSFDRFNVYEGNTVNLILPNNTENLVNFVNNETSYINGILNSIKNGEIGGRVFILNQHGVLFGKNSSVNVGSLNVFTPTKQQMEKYIDSNGVINDVEINNMFKGDIAITQSGLVTVEGKINTEKDVNIKAGNINISGNILSGTSFKQTNINFNDIVNTNNYSSEKMDIVVENGEITIKAVNNVEVSGKIVNDGASNVNAGKINITAGNNIKLADNSLISASGYGENSSGADIYIFADNSAELNASSVIQSLGGNVSGNGGNIEFSAKKLLSVKGGLINTTAINGISGNILLDPDSLEIEGNLSTFGGDKLIYALKDINILSDASILTANSSKNSAGKIVIEAPDISIGDNVTLNAQAENNLSSSGDITITASSTRNSPFYTDIDSKIDIGKNVTIKGKNITLSSTADTTHYFDDGSEGLDTALGFLDDFSAFAAFAKADAEASINIGDGTQISSVNDFKATSTVKAKAKMTSIGVYADIAVGLADTDSNINVGSGVKITAGNNINISANNESEVNMAARCYNLGSGVGVKENISVAYGNLNADTKVDIASGTTSNKTTLNAGNKIDISANTTKNMSITAEANSYEDGKAGIALAVSTSQVNNTIDVGGNLSAKNVEINSNVKVVDEHDKAGNVIKASTDVGSGLITGLIISAGGGVVNKASSWFSSNSKTETKSESSSTKLALAGAVAYADHTNNSTANIKTDTKITAIDTSGGSSGNIKINSETKEIVEVAAKSAVNPQDDHEKKNGVSVAVAISEFDNNSNTKINSGANLNASNNIDITSKFEMPYRITWLEINGVSDILNKLNGDLGVQNGIFTTWARSSVGTNGAEGDGIGLAGSVNIADFNSTTKAIVDKNVSINQDSALRTNTQKVNVDATNDIQTVNFSGIIGLKFFGADAGKTGAGGSYLDIDYDNDTQAKINSGANITANNLKVNASNVVRDLSIAVSASKAGKYGFSGSFAFLGVNNSTLAHIDSGSTIAIGDKGITSDDEDDSFLVNALDDDTLINTTGGIAKGGNAGIGVSLSVSEINRDTQAIVGKKIDDTETKSNLILTTETSGVDITAKNTGLISTWGLAGAMATGKSSGVGSADASSKGAAEGSGKFGLAVSGDVGMATIGESVDAYLSSTTLDTKDNSLNIKSTSNSNIDSVSGSAAITTGSGSSTGIAGSAGINKITSSVNAFILNSTIDNFKADETITNRGNINLDTDYDGNIFAISAGASGATKEDGIAVAGSVSINELNVNNSAYIQGSSTQDVKDININADNNADIQAYGGVLAAGKSAGVGAALALNTIKSTENDNSAYIKDSTINTAGNLKLNTTSNNQIQTVSGSIGVGKTAGIAASVSLNDIKNENSSYIEHSGITSAGLNINSKDTSTIKSLIASVAASGKVSAGAAVVKNNVENKVLSYINNSTTDVSNDISIEALSQSTIETASIAFSASGKVGLAGSASLNDINNETSAYISNSTSIKTNKNLSLKAEDKSSIKSLAGGLAIGGNLGVGASAATNDISNKIKSYIDKSTIEKVTDLTLTSHSNQNIETLSAGGAVSGTVSVSGAVSLNDISNHIESYISNGSDITSAKVTISAKDDSTIISRVANAAIAGQVAVGASVVKNIIENEIKSYIDSTKIAATGDIELDSTSTSTIESLSACLSAASQVGAAGAVSLNQINSKIHAYIVNSNDLRTIKTDGLSVKASDESTIKATAGGVAGSALGVAGSVAVNSIGKKRESDSDNYEEDYSEGSHEIKAYIANSKVQTGKDLTVNASSNQTLETISIGGAGGVVGVAGAVSVNQLASKTHSYIGDNSQITFGGNEKINATSNLEKVKINSGQLALGAYAGLGASVVKLDVEDETLAYVGKNTTNTSTGASKSLEIKADSKDDIDLNSIGISGGLAAANASYSEVNVNKTVKTYVDDNSTLSNINSINISANNKTNVTANSDALAAGGVAVGATIAKANVKNTVKSYLGNDVTINNAKKLDINAVSDSTANARTRLGQGGVASGFGVTPETTVKDTISAYTGERNHLTASDNLNVTTDGMATTAIDTDAISLGGISVGVTLAKSAVELNNNAYIGKNNTVNTANLNVSASQSKVDTEVAVYSAAGALIGVDAGKGNSSVSGNVNAYIDDETQVNSSNTVSVVSTANTNLNTKASSTKGGVIAAGYTEASSSADVDTLTELGDNVKISASKLALKSNNINSLYSDTVSGSGGIISGAGAVSLTTNTSNSTVKVGSSSSSKFISVDELDVDASNSTYVNSSVDTINAAVFGGSGSYITNDSDTTTNVSLADNSKITAKKIDISLTDKYSKTWLDNDVYNINSGSGGIVDAPAAKSETIISNNSKFSMGDNSSLLASSDNVNVTVNNDVTAYDKVKLVSGGAIPIARAESIIKNEDSKGSIEVGKNAKISAYGKNSSVNLAVFNTAAFDAQSKANTYGLASVAQGKALAIIKPTNNITLKENSIIYAEDDVNLTIGQTNFGNRSKYDINADVELFNGTALPFKTSPSVEATIDQDNSFDILGGATVNSVGDINVIAEDGIRLAKGVADAKNTYSKALSLDSTIKNSIIEEDTVANIYGNLNAGYNNIQKVILDSSINAADKTVNVIESGKVGDIKYSVATLNLKTNILDRIEKLQDLKQEYSGVPEAVTAYQNEINRLTQELADMGLVNDGRPVAAADVQYIILNDVAAGIGNININAKDLNGTGNMKANGFATIDIVNNSALNLQVNNLIIPDREGGNIYYNYNVVKNNSKINEDTGSSGANFSSLILNNVASDSTIRVLNTYDTGIPANTLPAPNMDLKGTILNARGLVQLKNTSGSIDSMGGISAGTLDINAGGAFVQSYTDTIFKVGGEPRTVWSTSATVSETLYKLFGSSSRSISDISSIGSSGGMIQAEGKIIIQARYIDINGKIQSGIDTKSITINDQVKIGDSTVTFASARSDYINKRNKGQNPSVYYALLDGNGYYNAKDDVIEINNIGFKGGYVELYGQIINTDYNGKGQVTVLDGFPKFSLDNNMGKKVILNNIDIGEKITGVVKITDLGKNKTYVYRKLGSDVKLYEVASNGTESLIQTWSNSSSAAYNPVTNSRYVWLTGQRKVVEDTYYYEGKSLWGAWDEIIPDDEWDEHTSRNLDVTPLFEGDFVEISASPNDYNYKGSTQVTSGKTNTYWREWTTSSGWGPWYVEYNHVKAKYETGYKIYNKHSIKADNPIGINFIGNSTGNISIDSVSDIQINGVLNNPQGITTINSNGSILAGGTDALIKTKDLTLTANNNIGTSINPININIVNSGYINKATSSLGDVALNQIYNDLKFDQISSGGNIYLTSKGDMNKFTSTSSLKGNSIYLTSGGSIGSTDNYIEIDTKDSFNTGVNASALNDIFLKEKTGNLGLINLTSKSGDVNIKVANGGIYDANSKEIRDEKTEAQMLQTWDDLHLTGQKAIDYANTTIKSIETSKTQDYKTYWNYRNKQSDPSVYNANFRVAFSTEEAAEFKTRGYSDVQIKAIEDQRTARYHELNKEYGSLGNSFNSAWTYVMTDSEKTALKNGAVWNENQLKNSITSGILDGAADKQLNIEDPNIVAKNVNIEVKTGVGKNVGQETITVDGSVDLTNDQKLALMSAEKDDMSLSSDGKSITVQKLQDADINATGGISITASGDVIVGSEKDVNINRIATGSANDVRILGSENIYNTASTEIANIIAHDLILEAGKGSIGSAGKAFRINTDGKIIARAGKDIYLCNLDSDIKIDNISAGELISINAIKNILDNENDSLTDIKAKSINLVANNIGTVTNTLDVSQRALAED